MYKALNVLGATYIVKSVYCLEVRTHSSFIMRKKWNEMPFFSSDD